MQQLKCCHQEYEWGRTGENSIVGRIVRDGQHVDGRKQEKSTFKKDSSYAELWMGTHKNGPSYLYDAKTGKIGGSLKDFLKTYEKGDGGFKSRLAYLDKISRTYIFQEQAKILHARDPKNYPDDNHKPEMAVALTEFEMLCGFAHFDEISANIANFPEVSKLIPTDVGNDGENSLARMFSSVWKNTQADIAACVEAIIERISAKGKKSVTEELMIRLNTQFEGGDVGVLAPIFMNYIVLQPGQAVYLDANIPHAYLFGDCIECMACSDNTIRAGLTPKYKDVETLCQNMNWRMGPPPFVMSAYETCVNPALRIYAVDKQKEFMIKKWEPASAERKSAVYHSFRVEHGAASVWVVLRGKGTFIHDGDEENLEVEMALLIPMMAMKISVHKSLGQTQPVATPLKTVTNSNELGRSWLEEYNHPSSTANVSIHETMGDRAEEAKSINESSCADTSLDFSSTFNSTAKSLFSSSIFTGSENNVKMEGRFPTDKLEAYTGSRPSFGPTTITSTPISKIFPTQKPPQAASIPSLFSLSPNSTSGLPVQTPVQKSQTPTPKQKLITIPEINDDVHKPNVEITPPKVEIIATTNKTEIAKQGISGAISLKVHYIKDLDQKEDNDIARERFEKNGDTGLRSTIKRTINEKLVVCKKHANLQDLQETVNFLSNLIEGKTVESHNGQNIQFTEEGAVAYIRHTVISYCMGVMERDNDLVHVLAAILRGISYRNSAFESVLFGYLFAGSYLLSLDKDVCTTFAETIASDPNRRTAVYSKERSIAKLFMACHLNQIDENVEYSRLNMRYLWRSIAIILNSPPCVISTVVLAISFLEVCTDKMRQFYSKQWPKLTRCLKEQLLPLLERNLQSSPICQSAGEAAFISVLCNELESL